LRGNRSYFALTPSAARRFPAAQPSTTVTEFTALSSPRSFSADKASPLSGSSTPQASNSTVSLSVEALSGLAGLSSPVPQETTPRGLGRLVGGWVRGRWGVTPMKSNDDLRSPATVSTPSSSADAQTPIPLLFSGGRPPGINQKGSIPGLRPIPRLPHRGVQVKMVDEDGLKEILAE